MAARLVLDVNRSPEPFVCWVSALDVKEADGPLVPVVPCTFDHPNRRLIFVKVSSLEDLAAEPFLHRAIRKLATNRGYALPFDVGLEYALRRNTPATGPLRRCGSTLLHRALFAVGACSLSEPHWLNQFYAPWGPQPGWTLARCVGHLLHVLCAGLLHVKDSKVFILNLKGLAAPPWTVRFWQTSSMCFTSRCIGMLWTCWNPSVPADLATSRLYLGRRICVRRMFLLYRRDSVLPTHFCKDMSLYWAETF